MSKSKFERPTIVMASSSPRRQELVRSLGLPYVVHPSDADETVAADMLPDCIVETLALRKARAVADIRRAAGEGGIVIGSDTIVVLDGKVLGKPINEEDAVQMLTSLQGNAHKVYTGVAMIDAAGKHTEVAHGVTTVHMKPWTEDQIRRYVATGEPMDKAGAYGIQGIGSTLVTHIEGCYFNVVGLPLSLVSDMLATFDIIVP
ncbi:Maf family protein [Paenibacillus alvei]|uniref:Maf family protein n=1 Tax=Paenibacillus alvei TaxID=44250 RepID=UPI0013D98F4F|nr:Maf family protein [Paenibacillus alvei]NEZ43852.1 septum formation inhibitor Maf [Paenibacillus alvei]